VGGYIVTEERKTNKAEKNAQNTPTDPEYD
jgi:hypothetical protein